MQITTIHQGWQDRLVARWHGTPLPSGSYLRMTSWSGRSFPDCKASYLGLLPLSSFPLSLTQVWFALQSGGSPSMHFPYSISACLLLAPWRSELASIVRAIHSGTVVGFSARQAFWPYFFRANDIETRKGENTVKHCMYPSSIHGCQWATCDI